MKKYAALWVIGLGLSFGAFAQTSTYIILRHAEKDTTAAGSTMMKADPPLTQQGRERAEKLLFVLAAYSPDAIYSTNYTRTKSTVTPLAKKFNKEIQVYEPKDLVSFSEKLLQEKGKTIIVAGHSNTTPQLVNLLIKEKKYANLNESVYNQLWIVTVRDGKGEARVVEY
ncbi:MAG: histidine phosphatase family protein [Chitinophagaceae bacterium]|nr:MAG: histidine phosphatase family protein [Chitinophagaceae bacterium]